MRILKITRLFNGTVKLIAVVVTSGIIFISQGRAAETHIVLLTTADMESQLEPFVVKKKTGDTEKICTVGGLNRIAQAVDVIRKENPNRVLLVSSGDDLMGKYYNLFHGEVTYGVMNALQYSVVTPGNHEFDYGIGKYVKAVKEAQFPIIVTNMDFRGTTLFEKIKKYWVTEIDGVRIGFIGLMTPDVRQITTIEDPIKVDINIFDVADEYAGYLIHVENVNIIVALTHIGFDLDLELARRVSGIDVICGGHSHTLLPTDKEVVVNKSVHDKTIIVESGEKSRVLGRLDLFIDNGKIVRHSWRVIDMDSTYSGDDAVETITKRFKDKVPQDFTVGKTMCDLDARRKVIRSQESNLGNFVADIMRKRFKADIALINGGALRGDKVYLKGTMFNDTMLEFFPFNNTVVNIKLSGAEIKDILELGVSEVERYNGRFLHPSGLKYTYNPGNEPLRLTIDNEGNAVGIKSNGKRVSNVLCKNKKNIYVPLKNNKLYDVVVGSYMAGGGDSYYMLKNKSAIKTYVDLRTVLQQHINEKKNINPKLDGRITITHE